MNCKPLINEISHEVSLQIPLDSSLFFSPDEGDNLFWCWAISVYGLSFYEKNLPFITSFYNLGSGTFLALGPGLSGGPAHQRPTTCHRSQEQEFCLLLLAVGELNIQ